MITLYLLIGLLVVDFIVFVNDKYITSAFGLLLIGVGAWYFIPEFGAFIEQHNWIYLASWYLGVGVIVALAKWIIINVAHYSKLKKARSDFQRRSDNEYPSTQARHLGFAKFWNNHYYKRNSTDPLAPEYTSSYSSPEDIIDALTIRARDHVDRMAGWIFQWPFVVIATVCEDLIVNLSKHIATFIDWAFNKFSRSFVASSIRDL